MPQAPEALAGYEGVTVGWRCGDGGLNQNLNPSRILLRNIIQAEGVVFYDDDWRKEPGTVLFGQVNGAPQILALHDYHPVENTQRLVTCTNGPNNLVTSTTAAAPTNPNAQTYTSAGSIATIAKWVAAGSETGALARKLFLFRDTLLPWYFNGDSDPAGGGTFQVIPKPAADWSNAQPPISGLVNGYRLWATGTLKNPHQVYASKQGDHTDFQTVSVPAADTDFQTFSLFPGVGERIYACANYQQRIAFFKYPRGIVLFDARSPSPADWSYTLVTDAIGVCQSPYAALPIDNDVLFLSADGLFYTLSAVLQTTGQSGIQPVNLSLDLEIYQYLLTTLDRTQMTKVQSVYFPFRQLAQFTFARPIDGGKNHARLCFDTARVDDGMRVSYSYRDTASAMALRRDPVDLIEKPMFGDYQGNIVLMEQSARDAQGAGYRWVVQTPHTNLGEFENFVLQRFTQIAHRRKNFDFLEIEYVPFTSSTITAQVYIDGVLSQTFTLSLAPQVGSGATLAPSSTPFILNTSTLADKASIAQSVRRRIGGNGRRISFTLTNTAADQDVAITSMFLSIRPGDEAAPRST